MSTTERYGHDYFERGIETGVSGYSNYRWIPELTIPLCDSIADWAGISKNDTILDYGCAKGYIVNGFRLLHYKCFGVDISQYAIDQALPETRQFVRLIDSVNEDVISMFGLNGMFDWIVCKDVLEHIDNDHLYDVLRFFKRSARSFAVIVPLGNGTTFNIPSYENDETHVIRRPLEWWSSMFKASGLSVMSKSYGESHIKDNYSMYENGNGFFLLGS